MLFISGITSILKIQFLKKLRMSSTWLALIKSIPVVSIQSTYNQYYGATSWFIKASPVVTHLVILWIIYRQQVTSKRTWLCNHWLVGGKAPGMVWGSRRWPLASAPSSIQGVCWLWPRECDTLWFCTNLSGGSLAPSAPTSSSPPRNISGQTCSSVHTCPPDILFKPDSPLSITISVLSVLLSTALSIWPHGHDQWFDFTEYKMTTTPWIRTHLPETRQISYGLNNHYHFAFN